MDASPQAMSSKCRQKTYLCIDLKSFYASVECADRGLDPFAVNLVVADPTRSRNTICLAITPAMKARGVRNRCRVRDIPPGMDYITAMPRMRRYMEVSSAICGIYFRFVAPEDVHVYSIDECFIDATPYLRLYDIDARGFARMLAGEVRRATGIAATAGIGPNLFLAKVALDVTAKHASDGIGMLDEESFRRELWFHQPITDIWGIGPGIARRLAKYGAHDLAGVCALRPETLRREFGKNAEVLLDHAWGQERCTIAQIKAYVPKGHSLTDGQVLMRDYSALEARTLLREMVYASTLELLAKGVLCRSVGLYVGYSSGGFALAARDAGGADAECAWAPFGTGAATSRKLAAATASEHEIAHVLLELYDQAVCPQAKIRRIALSLGGLVPRDAVCPSLFDDGAALREDAVAQAALDVRRRFGANALLRGTSLREESNARLRNGQIGGHRA